MLVLHGQDGPFDARCAGCDRVADGLVGVPAEAAIVTVARCDQPTRLAHSLHLAQRANGVSEMLEDLIRVHDVERVIVNVESVEVAHRLASKV